MTNDQTLPLEDRIISLMHRLGIERAHVAARPRGPSSLGKLLQRYPEAVGSLALVCPSTLAGVEGFVGRTLIVEGEHPARGQGPAGATVHRLEGYREYLWSDILVERPDAGTAVLDFLAGVGARSPRPGPGDPAPTTEIPKLSDAAIAQREGEVEGVTYRAEGSGAPLLLFPLDLAPSQWDPLLPELTARFTVIRLGGEHLDPVASHQKRAASAYGDMVLRLLREAGVRPGQSLLEVGCGSGALLRRIAPELGPASAIVGLDVNPFFLWEARGFALREGWAAHAKFQEGSAEELPIPDAAFDAVLSSTVLEEVDADQALREIVRVVRPGGRVIIVVRAVDRQPWFNLPIGPDLQRKLEAGSGGAVVERGCADGSLYQRMQEAGLAAVRALPHIAAAPMTDGWAQESAESTLAGLSGAEAEEWRAAIERVAREGIHAWIARPFHCGIGIRPRAP